MFDGLFVCGCDCGLDFFNVRFAVCFGEWDFYSKAQVLKYGEIDGYIVKMMTEEKAMQLLDEFLVCEISLLGTQLKGMTGNFQPATLQWFSTRHSNL